MDDRAVRRRLRIITSHLASNEDMPATATHLFPMSCSNSLNSVVRRRDSKMYFSRQESSSQGGFMRPASSKEEGKYVQTTLPFKPYNYFHTELKGSEVPMFSRPSGLQPNPQTSGEIQWLLQVSNNPQPSLETPCFARPSRSDIDSSFQPMEKNQSLESISSQWSPKMGVAESRHRYIITVELPGVSISNIRVEVNHENLIVTGNRSIRVASFANEATNVAYHAQEITQGPYKIVWPLPIDVNKDEVSAEFSDGLLQIIIPKLSKPRQKKRHSM